MGLPLYLRMFDRQVVHEEQAIVAERLAGEGHRLEALLVHEVVAGAVGVEIGGLDLHQIGLAEFLAGLERPVEHRARQQVSYLDPDQRLAASRGGPRDFDVEAVIRRAFVLQEHLALDVDRFDQ